MTAPLAPTVADAQAAYREACQRRAETRTALIDLTGEYRPGQDADERLVRRRELEREEEDATRGKIAALRRLRQALAADANERLPAEHEVYRLASAQLDEAADGLAHAVADLVRAFRTWEAAAVAEWSAASDILATALGAVFQNDGAREQIQFERSHGMVARLSDTGEPAEGVDRNRREVLGLSPRDNRFWERVARAAQKPAVVADWPSLRRLLDADSGEAA